MNIEQYKKYEPIDGKWYLTKELGRGAFGSVFEIERRDFTNDKSALKIISIPTSSSEVSSYREENYDLDEKSVSSYFYGFVEEFVKEFALMTKLKGQNNIVRIEDYDVKEHEGEVGWDIFIRMELLTPMNKHFAANAPSIREIIKLGIDMCKALEVCQKFDIVHRDIKPSNIFVSNDGEYKLGDFGVARTLEKTSSGLSKKGTYTYMAPEVYKGEAYGSNVDLYSLGIVMYKLLNNNMEPFKNGRTHEDEENALVARLKGEPMPKPANADGALADIVLKACAFDPKSRFETPTQMREALESVLNGASEVVASVEATTDDDKTCGIFDVSSTAVPVEAPADDDKTCGIFDVSSTVAPVEEVVIAEPDTAAEPIIEEEPITAPTAPVAPVEEVVIAEPNTAAEPIIEEEPITAPTAPVADSDKTVGIFDVTAKSAVATAAPIPEDDKTVGIFGSVASAPVEDAPVVAAEPTETVQCPACGRVLNVKKGQKFCSNCGADLHPAPKAAEPVVKDVAPVAPPVAPVEVKGEKKSRKGLWITLGIVGGAVLLTIILIIAIASGSSDDDYYDDYDYYGYDDYSYDDYSYDDYNYDDYSYDDYSSDDYSSDDYDYYGYDAYGYSDDAYVSDDFIEGDVDVDFDFPLS